MRSLRSLISAPVLIVGALILLTGCGTASDARQARSAVTRLYTAARQHDGPTPCAQLSPDIRAQLVKDTGRRCASSVLALSLHGSRRSVVRDYGTSAVVTLAGGDTVFLGYTREGWRIEALGCKPRDGGPYDCEAQS